MLVIRHLVFFTVAAPYGENSHCPDHKIMYHMSAHTLKHDVNIRDKRIRLRTTRKNPTRVSIPRADVFAKCIEIENRNRQGNILGTLGRKNEIFRPFLDVITCIGYFYIIILKEMPSVMWVPHNSTSSFLIHFLTRF